MGRENANVSRPLVDACVVTPQLGGQRIFPSLGVSFAGLSMISRSQLEGSRQVQTASITGSTTCGVNNSSSGIADID